MSEEKIVYLQQLVKELADVGGITLDEKQLKFSEVDWNSQVSTDGTIQIDGSDYITLAELRRLARLRGYVSSKPRVIQSPEYVNNRQATVEWEIIWRDGMVDGACADASWKTCNRGFSNFTVAIASNRAEARCIRAALGIETCSYEEIGPPDEDHSGPASDQQQTAVALLLSRQKTALPEILGSELLELLPQSEPNKLEISKLTNQQAIKVMAAINKYKGKK